MSSFRCLFFASISVFPSRQDDLAGAGMVPTEGPHAEVFPTKLHFHAGVKRQCLKTIRLRNGGTAAIQRALGGPKAS